MKHRILPILTILLFAYIGIVIVSNRSLLFSKFDQAYWKDKYEQSQWNLPFSPRTIGDDGLYLYEGYRLISGGDPTIANAEMPPLGKYMIGLSIRLFGNGYVFGLISTVFLIISAYVLALLLIRDPITALVVTLLLATDPLITHQFALTMMDALQSTFLLLFVAALTHFHTAPPKYHARIAVVSGTLLGLMAGTKAPLIAPLLGVGSGIYLWFRTKSVRLLFLFPLGAAASYAGVYVPFFLQGHTPAEWIGVQKWIAAFYLNSNLEPTWGSIFTILATGKQQNIYSRAWETASEWSPLWTLFGVLSMATIARVFSRTAKQRAGIFAAGALMLLVGFYAVVPFWSRYLVTVLPLLYIFGGEALLHLPKKISATLVPILIASNVIAAFPVLVPTPKNTAREFIYTAEHGLFSDLYMITSRHFQSTTGRDRFRRFGLLTLADGEIEHIDIAPVGKIPNGFTSPQILTVTATYHTRRLGAFTQTFSIPFVREHNRWRIPWQWSYVIPGLTETRSLETIVDPARRGTIVGSDKKPLAKDADGIMVWITPGKIDKTREERMLSILGELFGNTIPKQALLFRTVGNRLPDVPVPIGVLPYQTGSSRVALLSHYPGISFTRAYARATYPNNVVDIGAVHNSAYPECCSRLYTTTTYDGITGTEKEKNGILKGINGGTLRLTDANGNVVHTYISTSKRDGADTEP